MFIAAISVPFAIGNLPQSWCRIVILVALTWIARSAILPVTEA